MVRDHDDLATWRVPAYPAPLRRLQARVRLGYWDRFDVGQGWWPLLARLDDALAPVDARYELTRVASEAGILHLHAACFPDSIAFTDSIWNAMLEAVRTCEVCGATGVRRAASSDRVTVLCDRHARPLSSNELAVLAEAGLPDLSTSALTVIPRHVTHAEASRAFEDAVSRTHLSPDEMGAALGVTVFDVLSMHRDGDLASARGAADTVVFPRWQLVDGHDVLSGLHTVIHAAPMGWSAHQVRDVMLRPAEDLGGLSPRQWLVDRLPVAGVTALIRNVAHEQW